MSALRRTGALYARSKAEYAAQPSPFLPAPHLGLSTPVRTFACPADSRAPGPQTTLKTKDVAALTCYLGVSGKGYSTRDGVLFQDSRVRLGDITDGPNNTLMLGERPPSADMQFGWWYAGVGQHAGGANFAFADGSVRFLSYAADAVMPALASRAGGETVQVP